MAAEVLATALAKARNQDPAAIKAAFSELFKQFESPSALRAVAVRRGHEKGRSRFVRF